MNTTNSASAMKELEAGGRQRNVDRLQKSRSPLVLNRAPRDHRWQAPTPLLLRCVSQAERVGYVGESGIDNSLASSAWLSF
jgi:hypothetical protein